MGAKGSKATSTKSRGKVSKKAKKGHKDLLNLDLLFMSRHEADEILSDPPQKSGTFLIYEDADTRRTFLAFKSTSDVVEHHPITYHRDLYYLGSYPFPYLESIILYYRKHKLDSTRLTDQAFIEPYLMATRRIGRSPTPAHKVYPTSSPSPEIPRTHSFIAKYGVYRRYSTGNSGHESFQESKQVI